MSEFEKCTGCGKPVLEEWNSCPFCTTLLPTKRVDDGERVSSIILVTPKRNMVKTVATAMAAIGTVRDSFIITGDAGIYVKATGQSFTELRNFVVNSIGNIEGVDDTRTYMVVTSLKEMKETPPDPGKDPVRAILLLKVDQHMKNDIAETLIKLDYVEDVLLISGDHDIVVKGLFPSYTTMKDFVGEWMGDMDGILEQKTFMAVDIFKEHGIISREAEARIKHDELGDVTVHFPSSKEVYSILTNLPRGIPPALWGMEMDDLVENILKAKYGLTPRGYPIMNIHNKWFRGDIDDPSSYLQPWDGAVIEHKVNPK